MTNMLKTIEPKTDQLNADSLIGGTKTIRVTKVSLCAEPEQPIAINYEGDGGKPYKPCKSMRRVLVNVWGGDGNLYVGRSMTLYRDEKVLFGGMAVGGIRISHMSNIDKDVTMALTATRANRKPFTVKPLVVDRSAPPSGIDVGALKADGEKASANGMTALTAWHKTLTKEQIAAVWPLHGDGMKAAAKDSDDERAAIQADPTAATAQAPQTEATTA